MLKIKDNVDLKELEKFGFRFIEHKFLGKIDDNYYHYTGDRIIEINIEENTKYIYIAGDGTYDCDPDCADAIFDLIQAGLVEKV